MKLQISRPDTEYTAIPNKMVRDKSLSIEARGLMAMLMSNVDGWETSKDVLLEQTGMGRDKFERCMRELRAAGYVEITQPRNAAGQVIGTTWIVRDRTPEKPGLGDDVSTEALKNRDPAEPAHGSPAPIKRTTLQKDQLEKTPIPPEGDLFGGDSKPDDPPETKTDMFDDFWKVYPKKAGKKEARKAWASAIKRADPETIIAAAKRYAASLVPSRPDEFVPQPKNAQGWLSGDRWDDFPEQPTEAAPPRRFMQQPHGEVVR